MQEASLALLLLDAFLNHAAHAGTPLVQTLFGTELFVAVAMTDQAEGASAEITSVRFHLTHSHTIGSARQR